MIWIEIIIGIQLYLFLCGYLYTKLVRGIIKSEIIKSKMQEQNYGKENTD